MSDIVMIGGGVVGTCTAMMLANDGHRVTVLERDPDPPPDPTAAWDTWQRRGVTQFRMLYFLLARFARVADVELPELRPALLEAGATSWNPIEALPRELTGGVRPTDGCYETITGRRPLFEAVVARLAERTPGISIRRGVAVRGLAATFGHDGIPHISAVALDDGSLISGDLVVDAGGRRSAVPDMLRGIGARPPLEERDDCGFVYYGRHFRSDDGALPAVTAPLLLPYGSISMLTLPCDRGTWGVGIITSATDVTMRRLADPNVWSAAAGAFPVSAHWLDGEPITGIDVMARIVDRQRTFVVDGVPVATGLVAIGDAWACTNPSLGRGTSIGLLHGQALRDLLREASPSEPRDLIERWQQLTDERVEPLVRDTLAFDRHRRAEMESVVAGTTYETDDPAWNLGSALRMSTGRDPDLLRCYLDIINLLDRGMHVMMRPGVAAAALELADPTPLPGPGRDQLLDIVAPAGDRLLSDAS